MSKRSRDADDAILGKLRAFGLAYPGAHAKSPWPGHDDLAVNNKTFAYLSAEGDPFSISVKLPYTGYEALKLPFAKPTGYGLGKSGWVTVEPGPGQMPSFDLLKSWIDESYRAQAPKKLARGVIGRDGAARPKKTVHS
jgi:predicted DNA-binding protein (MmcQ/YjbR family)